MIANFGRHISSFIVSRHGIAVAIALLLLLPFDMIAVTRITGWAWWAALAALMLLNLVPLAGQMIYVGLAVAGAFYLGQDELQQRTAAAASRTSATSPQTVNVATLPMDKFVEWKRTTVAPVVKDSCLEDARRRDFAASGLTNEQLVKACDCYGAAAVNIIAQTDIVDNALSPAGDFNARLSAEAQRLCKP